jgi:hypothetical protein
MKGASLARRDSAAQTAAGQLNPIELGKILAESGYFADARQMAQAAVKVLAGQELGLGPIAAMTGVHIVQGKVTIGANLIAALIRKSGKYDYRIVEHTDQICRIVFYADGEQIGESAFSIEDAKRAGLLKTGPWTQHPRNMLFARALSNGAKWHAPDVFAGPIYTPDELGAVVDAEGDVVSVPEPQVIHAPAAGEDRPAIRPEDQEATPGARALSGRAALDDLSERFGAKNAAAVLKEQLGVSSYGALTEEVYREALILLQAREVLDAEPEQAA